MNDSNTGLTCLTVRLGAIAENFHVCGEISGAAVAGVVKADAYGLGLAPVARTLADAKCSTFFVARLEEGLALRPLLPDARIFVLDGVLSESVEALVTHRLIPVLNSLDDIAIWSGAARARQTVLDAALHFDTGMNRLGLPPDELSTLSSERPRRLTGINTVLVMSHLACSDDPSAPMNENQLERFRAGLAMLPPAPASLAASGGVLLGKAFAFDLVRPGVALYGGNPQRGIPNPFKTVAVLTGRILQLRRVDKGESVGYGATFRAARPSTLATVALGYADGLMCAIGNKLAGALDGIPIPVAGRVSMDLITLDVTDVPSAALGDEIEFIGDTISLEDAAAAAGTVNYEILTGLGSRFPRRYVSAT
ncbi:MAG TPA: alanine racemase [Rhizomicrobium sp.]